MINCKNFCYVGILFLVFALGNKTSGSSLQAAERLAILVYHHIEDPATSDVSCTPTQFASQIEGLLKAGFTPLTLSESQAFISGFRPLLRKPVLITFDDGYESLYHHALPVARKLKVPMAVFLVTSRLGLQPQFSRYLSRLQVSEMATSGFFEFGSHTHDLHTDILRLYESFQSFPHPVAALLRNDLAHSRKLLTEVVGRPPIAIAWPYGKFNNVMRRVAQEQLFSLHFTSIPGYNEPGMNPFSLKRIPVTSRDSVASVLRKAGGL